MHIKTESEIQKKKPFTVLTVTGFMVVISCAYFGFKVGGAGGAALGAFVGATICWC
jgi:hypothetical protein